MRIFLEKSKSARWYITEALCFSICKSLVSAQLLNAVNSAQFYRILIQIRNCRQVLKHAANSNIQRGWWNSHVAGAHYNNWADRKILNSNFRENLYDVPPFHSISKFGERRSDKMNRVWLIFEKYPYKYSFHPQQSPNKRIQQRSDSKA